MKPLLHLKVINDLKKLKFAAEKINDEGTAHYWSHLLSDFRKNYQHGIDDDWCEQLNRHTTEELSKLNKGA